MLLYYMQNLINKDFTCMNAARSRSPKGFNLAIDGSEETTQYLILGMMEELGEISGVLKKIKRPFNKRDFDKVIQKQIQISQIIDGPESEGDAQVFRELKWENPSDQQIVKTLYLNQLYESLNSECADLFCYLDLFCCNSNIDIALAVTEKFNQVSEQLGCPQFKLP